MAHNFFDKVRLKLIYLSAKNLGLVYLGGHFIKPSMIPRKGIIIDLGANKGNFTKDMQEHFEVSAICVEANMQLYQQLPSGENISNVYAAITDTEGFVTFNISLNDEASSINNHIANVWQFQEAKIVPSIRLDTLIKKYKLSQIDILKIDIEGAELLVLQSLDDYFIKRIPQITIEFHEFLDSFLAKDTYVTIQRLKALGFYIIVTSTNKYSEVLFINKRNVSFNLKEKFWYCIHSLVAYKKK